MRRSIDFVPEIVKFVLLTMALYFAAQTVIVILHEHAHSTAAWLLGYTRTPFTVVWGNPLTILGWDEGVPYDRLFPSPGHPAEAVIGGIPLLMHALFAAFGLYFLQRTLSTRRRLTFYAVYWFVVANLTELVAYIFMRPFIATGDTGRFNEGFEISPWPLFLVGSALLLIALWTLLRRVMPRLNRVAGESRTRYWITVCFTAFVMFLWGSGLRIMLLYPDRQWRWGLVGVFAFIGWIVAGRSRAALPLTQATSGL